MTQDKHQHSPYVELAQTIGINLSSEDAQKLAQFVNRIAYNTMMQERDAWIEALRPAVTSRMGAEQVREAIQAAIRARSQA